ncbi:hypothetical protein [Streptomyces sp. NPDC058011]|uniref:TetR/AcrR family transcriptional regulator n=1 Tax=Streptomyces sp. NPDC058011 TaxID=3346305 RepID=UPI0036EBC6FF
MDRHAIPQGDRNVLVEDDVDGQRLERRSDPEARLQRPGAGLEAGLGERVVRAFFDVWERDVQSSEPLMAMLRGAIANDGANEQLREFLQERLFVDALASRVPDEDVTLRVGIVSSMLVGLVVGRGVVGVPTLSGAEREQLIALVGPAVQSVLIPGGSR